MDSIDYDLQIKNSRFNENIFLVGTFEPQINIYAQQIRAINLVFSLFKRNQITADSRIAIIGAGMSGLSAACTCAILGCKEVTIYEKTGSINSMWRNSLVREISPNLFDWPEFSWEEKFTDLPFLNWTQNRGSDIAESIEKEFEFFLEYFNNNVELITNSEAMILKEYSNYIQINNNTEKRQFDTILLAIGFGHDGISNDFTSNYWSNDSLQSTFFPKKSFLLSGLGDGGIADFIRLKLSNINFNQIERWLKSDEITHVNNEIKSIEKRLAELKLNPDKNNKDSLSEFLNEAYKKIKTPELNAEIEKKLRTDNDVILHSRQLFAYDAYAFPLNRFLLSRLLLHPKVSLNTEFITSKDFEYKKENNLPYEITFSNGYNRKVDYIIVRHGPKKEIEQEGLNWITKSERVKEVISKNKLNFSARKKVFTNSIIETNNPSYFNYLDSSLNNANSKFLVFKYISKLSTKDILGLRNKFYDKYYYKRPFDDVLYDAFLNSKFNILLRGNSLSGKTRAVYELLNRVKEEKREEFILIVPKENELSILDIEALSNKDKVLIFLDDIEKFYTKQDFNPILEEIIAQNIKIIATCRTGPEFANFESYTKGRVKEHFKLISIFRISKLELAQNSEFTSEQLENSEFDRNIGSIILPLDKMRERYLNLNLVKSEENKVSVLILKALKCLFISSNNTQRSSYSIEKVKDIVTRRLFGKALSNFYKPASKLELELSKVSLETKKEEIKSYYSAFENALGILSSDYYNLNFIAYDTDEVHIEDVYLEKVVDDYKPYHAYRDISELYSTEEKIDLEFSLKIDYFNRKLQTKSPETDFNQFLKRMQRKGIQANSHTYGIIINKCINFSQAETWFENSLSKDLWTSDLFSSILNKAENLNQIKQILIKYESNKLKLLDYSDDTWNYLITELILFGHYDIGFQEVLALVEDYQFEIAEELVLAIISKLKLKSEEVSQLYQIIEERNLDINKNIIDSILIDVNDVEEALTLINNSERIGHTLNVKFYRRLIEKLKNIEEVQTIINHMESTLEKVDQSIYHILLSKTNNEKEAISLLESLEEREIFFEEETKRELIFRKTRGVQEAIHFFREKFSGDFEETELLTYSYTIQAKAKTSQDIVELISFVEGYYKEGLPIPLAASFHDNFLYHEKTYEECNKYYEEKKLSENIFFPDILEGITAFDEEGSMEKVLDFLFKTRPRHQHGIKKLIFNKLLKTNIEGIESNKNFRKLLSEYLPNLTTFWYCTDLQDIYTRIENCTHLKLNRHQE